MTTDEKDYLTESMKNIPHDGVVVEIGSWLGRSSVAISKGIKKHCPSARFFCVDIFSNEYFSTVPGLKKIADRVNVRQEFEKNMKKYPHVTMQETSISASNKFKDESIDFVFIDADHAYDAVKADIQAWLPKLKKGCTMCGHDYGKNEYGVTKAIDELFPVHKVPALSIWEIIK